MASDSYNLGALSPMTVSAGQQAALKTQHNTTQRGDASLGKEIGSQVAEPGASAELGIGASGTTGGMDAGGDASTFAQVAKSVDRINEMMQNGNQTLTFQLDDDSGRMVIRVMDGRTKEVIRQIPSEEALQFAKYVDGLVGLIFNEKA